MTINWEPLRPIIAEHQRFVLSSHVRPDADALGSELGMAALLEGMGKQVRIVNPSSSPANLLFLDPTQRIKKFGDGMTSAEALDTDVHMILDTSAWGQLTDLGSVIKHTKAKKVLIDHHVSSDDLGAVEFKDTNAEATGALVFQLFRFFDVPIPKAAVPAVSTTRLRVAAAPPASTRSGPCSPPTLAGRVLVPPRTPRRYWLGRPGRRTAPPERGGLLRVRLLTRLGWRHVELPLRCGVVLSRETSSCWTSSADRWPFRSRRSRWWPATSRLLATARSSTASAITVPTYLGTRGCCTGTSTRAGDQHQADQLRRRCV